MHPLLRPVAFSKHVPLIIRSLRAMTLLSVSASPRMRSRVSRRSSLRRVRVPISRRQLRTSVLARSRCCFVCASSSCSSSIIAELFPVAPNERRGIAGPSCAGPNDARPGPGLGPAGPFPVGSGDNSARISVGDLEKSSAFGISLESPGLVPVRGLAPCICTACVTDALGMPAGQLETAPYDLRLSPRRSSRPSPFDMLGVPDLRRSSRGNLLVRSRCLFKEDRVGARTAKSGTVGWEKDTHLDPGHQNPMFHRGRRTLTRQSARFYSQSRSRRGKRRWKIGVTE